MPALTTQRLGWLKVTQATVDQTAVSAPGLGYSGTWATGAQNPAVWPSGAKTVSRLYNGVALRFIVADTADDGALAYIWTKSNAGTPMLVAVLTITAGTTTCEKDPTTGTALTGFYFADTIVLTTGREAWFQIYSPADNSIAEVRFDLAGSTELYICYDCEDATVTNSTDVIAYMKGY